MKSYYQYQVFNSVIKVIKTNAAFTLSGFDDQERNLMVVKTDFQVSKLKFHACNCMLSILFINYYIA